SNPLDENSFSAAFKILVRVPSLSFVVLAMIFTCVFRFKLLCACLCGLRTRLRCGIVSRIIAALRCAEESPAVRGEAALDRSRVETEQRGVGAVIAFGVCALPGGEPGGEIR